MYTNKALSHIFPPLKYFTALGGDSDGGKIKTPDWFIKISKSSGTYLNIVIRLDANQYQESSFRLSIYPSRKEEKKSFYIARS